MPQRTGKRTQASRPSNEAGTSTSERQPSTTPMDDESVVDAMIRARKAFRLTIISSYFVVKTDDDLEDVDPANQVTTYTLYSSAGGRLIDEIIVNERTIKELWIDTILTRNKLSRNDVVIDSV